MDGSKSIEAEIDSIAFEVFEALARRFPVCTASDEFHFFPQVRFSDTDWSCWDDFSDETVRELSLLLEKKDNDLVRCGSVSLNPDEQIDVSMLRRMIRTVFEQLTHAAAYRVQPTFYLTILAIGLGEASEAGPDALKARFKNLPDLLDRARHNLKEIPRLFRDMGIEMIRRLKPWLQSIQPDGSDAERALRSLDRFYTHLDSIPVTEEFLMPEAHYERIAFFHMGCFSNIEDIARELDREITETRSILEQTAKKIEADKTWTAVLKNLSPPVLPAKGVRQAYRMAVSDLAGHCRLIGMVAHEFITSCPVRVEPVPHHLLPVRGNAAYSMPPGPPASGGTFFIIETPQNTSLPSDYRLLTAHETYPGHHLLDANRWRHKRPIRRHIEFPIFYEGWACFAEEILFDTGFFDSLIDRLLLAKRRFFRAIRGRVDLDIHTRKMNLQEAAMFMATQGMDKDHAVGMVRRHILKPGYQLAYAIGRRRFRGLYEKWIGSGGDPVAFARRVLAMGQIGFDHMEAVLFKEKEGVCE